MTVILSGILSGEFGKGADIGAFQRAQFRIKELERFAEITNPVKSKESTSDEVADFAATVISLEQSELFQSEINVFHEASYEALAQIDAEIDLLDEKIENILDNAHTLEDGRRVFKTEDGTRVFDEFGQLVETQIIDPIEISDELERWEVFDDLTNNRSLLLKERGAVIDFQSKTDHADERLNSGELSTAEYNDLRDELYNTAPDRVRGIAAKRGLEFETEKDAETSAPSQEMELDLDSELAEMARPNLTAPGLGG